MKSKTKMVFYEQTCSSCDFLKIQGRFPCETRYCTNFPQETGQTLPQQGPGIQSACVVPQADRSASPSGVRVPR